MVRLSPQKNTPMTPMEIKLNAYLKMKMVKLMILMNTPMTQMEI